MRRDTLVDFFTDVAAGRGEFLVYDDGFRARSYTYADIAAAARGFAARLQAAGIRKSDKVVFWSENRPDGSSRCGDVAERIHRRTDRLPCVTESSTRSHGRRCQLICSADDVSLSTREGIVFLEEKSDKDLRPLCLDPQRDRIFARLDATTFTPVRSTRDDTVEIIFTSVSTAEPKGVILTHRMSSPTSCPSSGNAEIQEIRAALSPDIRFLNLLPLSHISVRRLPPRSSLHGSRHGCGSCAATTRMKSCGK